ncbi:MAG: class IV adenylate cyclase [Planctomycetota bacterium]
MRNIEFKAELRDRAMARAALRKLGASPILEMRQTDTYYNVPSGRLKKRECPGEPTEWVQYDRPHDASPKASDFSIYTEREAKERFGEAPLPVWLVVSKVRELYMLANCRIHLDIVEDLGEFLEVEALVSKDHPEDRCREAVREILDALRPALGEMIGVGYADLLAARAC